jgi:hypothetical protein
MSDFSCEFVDPGPVLGWRGLNKPTVTVAEVKAARLEM